MVALSGAAGDHQPNPQAWAPRPSQLGQPLCSHLHLSTDPPTLLTMSPHWPEMLGFQERRLDQPKFITVHPNHGISLNYSVLPGAEKQKLVHMSPKPCRPASVITSQGEHAEVMKLDLAILYGTSPASRPTTDRPSLRHRFSTPPGITSRSLALIVLSCMSRLADDEGPAEGLSLSFTPHRLVRIASTTRSTHHWRGSPSQPLHITIA